MSLMGFPGAFLKYPHSISHHVYYMQEICYAPLYAENSARRVSC